MSRRLQCRFTNLTSTSKFARIWGEVNIHHAFDYAVYLAQLISSNPAKALLEKYPFGSAMYMPLNLNRQIVYLKKRGYFLTSLLAKSASLK